MAGGHGVAAPVYSVPVVSGLYVPNAGADSITVHAPRASGNVAPLRTISGDLTGLEVPYGVALDTAGNLYVTNGNPSIITVYAPGARGNVAPIRTIRGALTGLNNPIGLALDATGALYVANNDGNVSSITVYAPGASGNVAPLRTIMGPLTGLTSVHGVALDAGRKLYVTNGDTHRGGPHSIMVFAPGATGNVKPLRTIMGDLTRLSSPDGVALDVTGTLYVANFPAHSVTVYAPGATGNVSPLKTLRVQQPVLLDLETAGNPVGLALDATGTLYVANLAAHSITVYAPGATGNMAPLRTISGGRTGLNRPGRIYLRP